MPKSLKSIVDYYQPDFYHFTEDSILLANKAIDMIEGQNLTNESLKGLEMCAGCGVVGLEILKETNRTIDMDFCEIQKEFYPFFCKNRDEICYPARSWGISTQWFTSSFVEFVKEEYRGKYDFVVSNPPFFQVGHGRLSNSRERNLCRFFIEGSFRDFFCAIINCLKKGGTALFLGRDGFDHGFDIQELINECILSMQNCVKVEVERIDRKRCLYKVF